MIITKTITKSVEIPSEVTCNCCGQKIESTACGIECATLSASWGYGSGKDCEVHSAEICETCYDKIIEMFKIPPKIDIRA